MSRKDGVLALLVVVVWGLNWKSLKRIIKKGPNGPFNYCVCSSSVTGQRRKMMIDHINAAKAGTAPT